MAALIKLDYDPFATEPQGVLPEPGEPLPVAPVAAPAPEPEPVAAAPEPVAPPPVQKPTVVPAVTVPAVTNIPVIKFADQEKPKPKPTGLIKLDYDPFAEHREPDSWTDPKDYALLRGGAEGLESIKGGKDFLTVLDLSFGGKSDEEKKKIILEQAPETAPTGWERRVPSITDIGSVGDVGTWLQESAGSGVTSTIPSVVGGLVGGVGGTALAGPVGGLIGGYGGAAIPSVALGLSGMYQDMRGNEGVRKALADGTITPDQFQKIVVVGGLMTGALDSIPAAHWTGKALGLETVKKEIRETLIKAAIKGGFEEGGTEGLQQVVSEAGQDMGGGNASIGQQALNVLDASLQGMVGGMIFGAATREKPAAVPNTATEADPKADDTPDVSAVTQPEGTPASTESVPDNPPGGVGATPAQPTGTDKQPDSASDTPAAAQGATVTAVVDGVETVAAGQSSSDVAAALSGKPIVEEPRTEGPYAGMTPTEIRAARAKQRGAIPEEESSFSLRDEMPEEATTEEVDAATAAQQETLKGMFAGDDLEEATPDDIANAEKKKREKRAAKTTVAPANDDTKAALEAITTANKETLGTGRSLDISISGQQQTAQPAVNVGAVAEPTLGGPAAAAATGRTDASATPGPPVTDETLQAQQPPAAANVQGVVQPPAALNPAAAQPAAGTTASVPFMLTAAMRQDLRKLGYSTLDIKNMVPAAAHDILSTGKRKEALVEQNKVSSPEELTAAFNVEPAAEPAAGVVTPEVTATEARTAAPAAAEPVTPAKPKTAPPKAEAAKETGKQRKARLQAEADAASERDRLALKAEAGRAAPQPKTAPPKAAAAVEKSKNKETPKPVTNEQGETYQEMMQRRYQEKVAADIKLSQERRAEEDRQNAERRAWIAEGHAAGRTPHEMKEEKGFHPVVGDMNAIKRWLNGLSDEDYASISREYGGKRGIDQAIHHSSMNLENVQPLMEGAVERGREAREATKAEPTVQETAKTEEKVAEQPAKPATKEEPTVPTVPRERKPLTVNRTEAPKATAAKIVSKMRAKTYYEGEAKTVVHKDVPAAKGTLEQDIHRASLDEARRVHKDDLTEAEIQQAVAEEAANAASEIRQDEAAKKEADPDYKSMTPTERVTKGTQQVAERIRQRVEEKEKAEQAAYKTQEELDADLEKKNAAAKEARLAAEQELRERQAQESGQKKERRGSDKGLSSHGRSVQSHKSLMGEYEEEKAKAPDSQDPLVMAYGREQEELVKLPPNSKAAAVVDARADHEANKAAIKAELVQRAKDEEEAAAKEELSKEHAVARDKVQEALDKTPMVDTGLKPVQQKKAFKDHLEAFRKALAGINLPTRVSRAYHSMQEDLGIFARRKDTTGEQFAVARMFAETGAEDEFYGHIMAEELTGSGYSEDVGEDLNAPGEYVAQHEDETAATKSVYRDDSTDMDKVAVWGEAQALIRHSKEEAQRQRTVKVTRPDGKEATITASSKKASAVMRDLPVAEARGFVGVIQRALTKHLTDMVGNVNVHFVSQEDLKKLHEFKNADGSPAEVNGLYFDYSPAQRAQGLEPAVFIASDLQTMHEMGIDSRQYTHTVLHEMTHAATSLAIKLNLRGTQTIISKIMKGVEAQMTAEEKAAFKDAFISPAEFTAEVFSNEDFQNFLARKQVPPKFAEKISGVAANRMPNWLQSMAAAVSNAIGVQRWGTRGQSYMEHIVSLLPTLTESEIGQEIESEEYMERVKSAPAMPRGHPISEPQALLRDFDNIFAGAKSMYSNSKIPGGRRFRDVFATGGTQVERSHQLFGGWGNPMQKLIQTHLGRDTLRNDLRLEPAPGIDNQKVELAVEGLERKSKTAWRTLSSVLHDMSQFGVDGTVGLADKTNSHIEKSGTRHQQERAMHGELEKRWNKLPKAVQDIGRMVIEHYRAMAKMESESIITNLLENAQQKYGAALPAGKTIDDAVQWIMSGDARRTGTNRTQADKDWHAALGKTAESLADVPMLRAVKGVYVPFMRRGRWFISARERPFGTLTDQKNLPKGAVLDAVTAREKEAPNRLLFKNEADYNAFMDTHQTQARGKTMYVDPTTGKKTTRDALIAHPTKPNVLVIPKRVFVATVQNHRVEMSDNKTYLIKRARELQAEGHHVRDISITDKHLQQVVREHAPPEITRLLNSASQTTMGQTTVGQETLQNSIYDAYIRSRTSPGTLARGMKRRGTLGVDLDLTKSLRDYNRDMANHLANAKVARELAQHDAAVKKYINDHAYTDPIGSGLTANRQALHAEVADRIRGYQGDSNTTATLKVSNSLRSIVNWKHLMSPHFSIMNVMQPGQTTLPVLSARHGPVRAAKAMDQAYRIGGRAKTVWGGIKRTVSQTVNIMNQDVMDVDDYWKEQVRHEPDGASLMKLNDRVRQLGYGASSGIEAPHISRLDMNPAEKAIDAISNIATALPEMIEGMNRHISSIAAYRLLREDGVSEEEAIDRAAMTVEETQGGYGAANNPTFFQNPLLNWALQFRKYGLNQANLFYKNLKWSIGSDKVKRKQAIKTLAGLSLATVALAGMTGLPLVEPLRFFVNVLHMFDVVPDDWDDVENGMQNFMAKMIEWTTGSKSLGQALSEAQMYGYTRLANIDTHNMFGNDSLVLFGQPKTADSEGLFAWLGKAMTGATGGMFADAIKNVQNGDYLNAVPWPKVMQNMIDAYKIGTKGTVDPKTGKQYHQPYSPYEVGLKALGLRPAEESRAFEAGGSASTSKEMKQSNAQRRSLMEKWRNKSPGDRADFFRGEIRDWNASHRNPDDKIQMQDLLRSGRSAKQYDKRLKKFEQYADD